MKGVEMYIGLFEHSLDEKNRLFIPAKFRRKQRQQSPRFVLTRGLDGCLNMYAVDSWQRIVQRLDNLPLEDKIAERAFKRMLLSGATEVQPDSQGRLLLPQHHCSYAGITREVVIIGVGNRIELWAKEQWQEYRQRGETAFAQIAERLEL